MDRKIRRIAITVPVAIAILAGCVIIYSVLQAAGGTGSVHASAGEAVAANPDVAIEEMVCDFDVWIGKEVAAAEAELRKLGRAVRVLGKDTPATMDYRHDRVNVIHDENGVITSVTCG
ncbi:I78 family peptidase inhibitor [Micavibrio aeruginosavorus]|uniref:I78 family peptidase inhibitor n=1 Tax=Micavibrio aeruginosavorus TaxID=349221 RepID=UPI003F4AC3D8